MVDQVSILERLATWRGLLVTYVIEKKSVEGRLFVINVQMKRSTLNALVVSAMYQFVIVVRYRSGQERMEDFLRVAVFAFSSANYQW